MDLSSFKLDIDGLVDEFGKSGSTSFTDIKKIWCSKKFSFMFEAAPSCNLGFFMQSLYEHSLGYMFSASSQSYKLGGLYCLYCLHETQPFKPPFRIYLSVGEVKKLRDLVHDATEAGIGAVSALVKRMLANQVFSFGCVDIREGCFIEKMNDLTEMQNALVQAAQRRLLSNTRIEEYIHLDLGKELDLQVFKTISTEYSKAKQLAINEAREVADVQNIQHIAESTPLVGDVMQKLVEDWNAQKQMFCKKTSFCANAMLKQGKHQYEEVDDDFAIELESLLT